MLTDASKLNPAENFRGSLAGLVFSATGISVATGFFTGISGIVSGNNGGCTRMIDRGTNGNRLLRGCVSGCWGEGFEGFEGFEGMGLVVA